MTGKEFGIEFAALMEVTKKATGRTGLPGQELMELVRRGPEAAVEWVDAVLKGAEQAVAMRRSVAQMAHAVAGAYEAVEADDSLRIRVERKLTTWGLKELLPQFIRDPNVARTPEAPDERVLVLRVDAPSWRAGATYVVTRIVGNPPNGADNPQWLRRICGKVRITFDGLHNDPREVWQVPEVRAFMQKLRKEAPGLAFWMDFSQEGGMLRILYLSLADPSAEAPGNGVNLYDASFLSVLLSTLIDMRSLCQEAGIGWPERCQAVLRDLPPAFQDHFFQALSRVK